MAAVIDWFSSQTVRVVKAAAMSRLRFNDASWIRDTSLSFLHFLFLRMHAASGSLSLSALSRSKATRMRAFSREIFHDSHRRSIVSWGGWLFVIDLEAEVRSETQWKFG